MKLIVGLGNPKKDYGETRHNVGFIITDFLQSAFNLENFKYQNNYDAWISQGVFEGKKFILAEPDTFMNESGKAVQAIMSFYKIAPEDLIVIHDDLDIEIGNYKISKNASSAGHNGVADIMEKIGTQDFTRVRIGVETAGGRQNRQIPGEDFVLQKFTEEEKIKLKEKVKGDVLFEITRLL